MLPRPYCIQDHQPFLQHLSAFSSLTSAQAQCHSHPSALLWLNPQPHQGKQLKAVLCTLLQHCSEPQEKTQHTIIQMNSKRSADLLLADTELAEGDLACLTALLPAMGKLQPQDAGVDVPGILGYSCSQSRGCNAAVNPAICLGSCRVIICLQ